MGQYKYISLQDGVNLYFDKDNNYIDIDIRDDVTSVMFAGIPSFTNYIDAKVELKNIKKRFPNVKELIIGGNVLDINVSNYMFPNVRNIKSYNSSFTTDKILIKQIPYKKEHIYINRYYNNRIVILYDDETPEKNKEKFYHSYSDYHLQETKIHYKYELLNTFELKSEELIDLSDYKNVKINSNALEGCMTRNIKNEESITSYDDNALENSIFLNEVSSGCCLLGNSILSDISSSLKYLVLPDAQDEPKLKIINQSLKDKIYQNKKELIVIHKIETLELLSYLPKTIILDFDVKEKDIDKLIEKEISLSDFDNMLERIVITNKSKNLKTYKSIIYNKDNTELFRCPSKKEFVELLNSTNIINCNAFLNCKKIKNIKLPKELKIICENAFENCYYLSNVIFPDGLLTIKETAFFNCNHLTSIKLPNSINFIGIHNFESVTNIKMEQVPVQIAEILKDDDYKKYNNVEFNFGGKTLILPMYAITSLTNNNNLKNDKLFSFNENEAYEYLKEKVKAMIKDNDIASLIDFLNYNLLNGKGLHNILTFCGENNFVEAAALIMNYIERHKDIKNNPRTENFDL